MSPTPAPRTLVEVAQAFATADHRPGRAGGYLPVLRAVTRTCRARPAQVDALVAPLSDALRRRGLPEASRLLVARALARSSPVGGAGCGAVVRGLRRELARPAHPRTPSGWGGYAGSVSAWDTAHRADPRQTSSYLPRLAGGGDTYQLFGGSTRDVVRRFEPPVPGALALAVVRRDLLPGKVHAVYQLTAHECQQAVYLGRALGAVTGDASVGAYVELTSGAGVGRTRYDPLRVNRARLTPGGAIGGQPCT